MAKKLYHVRQYRPAYFTGFENDVLRDVPYDAILTAPWCENFKHSGLDRFTIKPYRTFEDGPYKELIIEAHYKSGEHWVVGFAVETTAPFADDWRYKPHQS